MDNLCHTLVGAAIGRAGFRSRTSLASATLMIAANIPDLDVLVFATDEPSISFRRGWTHGVVAQALLPLALAAVMTAFGRWRGTRPGAPPLRPGWLLGLSYLGLASHVFLDFLNTYGIRLLAPVDWRWFYGDAVFIVDLFLWMALGVGIWLARRRARVVFARGALVFAGCYVATMLASAHMAREITADAWRGVRGTEPVRVMVGPAPLTPFTRVVIVDAADRYEVGTFRWWPIGVTFEPMSIPKNDRGPEVARASEQSRLVRGFLVWSRFPAWTIEPTPRGSEVSVIDLRFASRAVNGARFQASTIVERGALPGSSHRADPR
jgi:inner membrane protein